MKWNSELAAAESAQVVTNGCTAIESDPINGSATIIASGLTAAESSLVAKGGRAAIRHATVTGSGDTASQSSQSTRGGATTVGCNLHGIVTELVPIELKLFDFTLQTYLYGWW